MTSANHKGLEWPEASSVGFPKRGQVPLPSSFSIIRSTDSAPREGKLPQRLHEVVRSLAAVSPIAIGKRMDPHEAVVEPNRNALWLLMLGPDLGVSNEISNRNSNLSGIDADRRLESPIRTRPFPDFAKHQRVKVTQVPVIQQLLKRRLTGSLTAPQDVRLLGLVQLTSSCDVTELQTATLVVTKRSVAITERQDRVTESGHRRVRATGLAQRLRSSMNRSVNSST